MKTFEPLRGAFGLGGGLIPRGGIGGVTVKPENANEEGNGLGGDALVAFQPGDLA